MRIPFAPIDYFFAWKGVAPIQFLFAFADSLEEARLRASLREVLTAFPLLEGHIEEAGHRELVFRVGRRPHGRHVSFHVRRIDEELCAFDKATRSFELIDQVIPACHQPLLKVTLNHLRDQSVLGVSMSHVAGDGSSFFRFIDAWARTYSGTDFELPSFDRTALFEGLAEPLSLTPERILQDTGYTLDLEEDSDFPDMERTILRMPWADLATMKQEVMSEAEHLSHSDVLTAHLFRCFQRYAPRRSSRVVTLRCPVNYRRHHPGLAPSYFGNALRDAVAEYDANRLSRMSTGQIAMKLRRAVSAIDVEAVLRSLSCMNDIRHGRGPAGFTRLSDPGLAVSNYSRLNMEGLDFGGLRPSVVLNSSYSYKTINVIPRNGSLEAQFLHFIRPRH